MPRSNPLRSLRLQPIAACLAALLGLGNAPEAVANPSGAIVVTSCQDSGTGSLRAAVAMAGDGDAIDLTQLSCSQITLTTGRIDTTHNLLLQGPGSGLLTIDGNHNDRIFNQNANAVLAIYGLTLQDGYDTFGGGCIYSAGPVLLNDAVITGCRLVGIAGTSIYEGGAILVKSQLVATSSRIVDNEIYASLGGAVGGGVVVTGDLVLMNSTISGNSATTVAQSGIAKSGGVDVGGILTMQYSTIADNTAYSLYGGGVAGGALVIGPATIRNSTISGNTAAAVGGLRIYGQNTTSSSVIVNSTISDNVATASVGGIYSRGPLTIANTTIAFNTEANSLGGGLRLHYGVADVQSSIIAANVSGAAPANIGLGIGGGVSGSNNLIGDSGSVTLPPDTIQSDPRLLPLANNGGPTLTHALRPDSPALEAGNNSQGLANDQRGPPFLRVLGVAADIGAVEFDSDVIFGDGFD
jgi:hypothetical protein